MFRLGHNLIVLAAMAVFFTASRAEAGFVSTISGDSFALAAGSCEPDSVPSRSSDDSCPWFSACPQDAGMVPTAGGRVVVDMPVGCHLSGSALIPLMPNGTIVLGSEPLWRLPLLELDTPPPRLLV